jgi:hypothetical protein
MDGMAKQNKGNGKGGKSPATGGCKKTDSFSKSNMGIDPSLLMDQLMIGDKKSGSPMACGKKAVAYIGIMGICDGWIQYGRQARDNFLRNNGCKPKEAQIPVQGASVGYKRTMSVRLILQWYGPNSMVYISLLEKQKTILGSSSLSSSSPVG